MSLQHMFVYALVALLIGLSKGGLGGPVPISLTAPLLSLIMPASKAVGIVLPLLIFADMFALYFYWQKWDMHYVRLMLPAAVIGVIMGSVLLASLSNETLKRIIGGFTLIAVLYKLTSDQLKSVQYTPRPWHGHFAGWASGFGSALANAGSPPFTAYMLLQPGMQPIAFIGTTSLFFAIVNLLKVPSFLSLGVLDVHLLLSIAWVTPLIPFGVWAARKLIERINAVFFERLMLALLFMLSVWLLVG